MMRKDQTASTFTGASGSKNPITVAALAYPATQDREAQQRPEADSVNGRRERAGAIARPNPARHDRDGTDMHDHRDAEDNEEDLPAHRHCRHSHRPEMADPEQVDERQQRGRRGRDAHRPGEPPQTPIRSRKHLGVRDVRRRHVRHRVVRHGGSVIHRKPASEALHHDRRTAALRSTPRSRPSRTSARAPLGRLQFLIGDLDLANGAAAPVCE